MEKTTLFDTLVVVKRSGQRTTFQGEKIALAIKKAFDSVDGLYQEEDINRVYEAVLKKIIEDYQDRKTIQIEDIQDLIEMILQKKNYQDVFLSFKTYREHRSASRKSFVTKQQHKFLKSIEALGFNDKDEVSLLKKKNPNELLENYGRTIASGFTKSYLLDTKIVRALDSGLINIPYLESIALGSIENIELDVTRLFKEKITLTNGIEPNVQNIEDFFNYLLLLIKSVANCIHGQILLSHLDEDTVPFILNTYKECLMDEVSSFLEYSSLKNFLSLDRIEKEIDKLVSIQKTQDFLKGLYPQDESLRISFEKAIKLAQKKMITRLSKSIKYFLTNLNSIYDKTETFPKISIGLGTVKDEEAIIFIKLLLKIEKDSSYIEPTYFFKLTKEVPKELEEAFETYFEQSLRSQRFAFVNLNTKYNKKYYEEENSSTEVCYFHDGGRVIEDETVQEARIMGGKGNLFTCSINLPRLILKAKQTGSKMETEFFTLLEQSLELAKDALLSCFEHLTSKKAEDFPLLLGQNIWQDGKNMKEKDRLRKLFKHGTLSIHFVGLEEVLSLFPDEKKTKLALKILEFMQRKVDSYCHLYNLNFTLSAKKIENVCREFNQIDTAIYGKIKGITEQEAYHNAFQKDSLSWKETKDEEARYHPLTLGGHLSCFELSKKELTQAKEILKIIKKEAIGAFYFKEKH